MKQPKRTKRPTSRQAVTGVVRANARGFGFLEPAVGPDIFLPAPLMVGLLDGDTVTAEVSDTAARQVSRTDRARTVAHGRVSDGVFTADPSIGTLTAPLKGTFAADEIIAVKLQDRNVGDAIVTDVTLLERLGTLDNPETLTKVIFARYQLPVVHSEAQLNEARRAAKNAGRQRRTGRRDLREQLVTTIDSPHSQDLDDAVAASVDPDGHIRVWVHIADVSEHVTPGSVLDIEALTMPSSVYFPDFVRPMLPPVLAHDVLSLLPGLDRDTLTVEMRISPSGIISAVDVYESLTRSRTRLSYSTVSQVLNGARGKKLVGLEGEDLAPEVIDTIGWLWAAASRLGQSRSARGGVDAFRVDSTPGQERNEDNAHLLIERLMVAANESVARWLTERGIPTLYRVHDAIDAESAEELEKIADAFGVKAHLGRPVTAQAFAAFAASLDETRSAGLWDVILGLLGRARYSTESTGHFGLGAEQYLHFTSPIRRYADLCVHRLVKAYLNGNRDVAGVRNDLDSVSSSINPVLRRADLAMRDAGRSTALSNVNIDKRTVNGVVTSVTSRGLSVLTPVASVAVFIPSKALGTGSRIDQARRVLVKTDGTTIGVGGRLEVNLVSVDVLAGRIEGSLQRSSRGSKPGTSTSAKKNGSVNAVSRSPRDEKSTESRKPARTRANDKPRDVNNGSPKLNGKNNSRVVSDNAATTSSPNAAGKGEPTTASRNPRRKPALRSVAPLSKPSEQPQVKGSAHTLNHSAQPAGETAHVSETRSRRRRRVAKRANQR